ncbi:MAG: septum formation protein Maf [Bacteroidetes bacterium]|nr:septum formation protein Maf [Bacteroidota bacterium]MBS1650023.1 septum formation protein Maf [Bacteroidota bacterium]
MKKIILASQSPRRKQLLEWAEIPFDVMVSDADESFSNELTIKNVPVFIAKQKALAIKNKLANNSCAILAADTVVVFNNTIIGKPNNKNEAIKILSLLSGKIHTVITGVVILKEEKEITFSDITEVEFHTLTQEQIEFYVEKYKPYDKAGAYAIQEWIGVVGIKQIKGDFYNVMGLPISRVVQTLQQL